MEEVRPTPSKPGVVTWYRVYTILMAILYLAIVALVSFGWFIDKAELRAQDFPPVLFYLYMALMYGLGLTLAIAFIVSFFLKPKPWTWIYHLVLICIGLTSPCCLPVSVPLLIYWFKEDNLKYFGRK